MALQRGAELGDRCSRDVVDEQHGVRVAHRGDRELDAFRKETANRTRGPVNKALFESWAVSLLPYDETTLRQHRQQIVDEFLAALSGDLSYYKSISSYTGNRTAVARRFHTAESIIAEACRG